MGTVRQGENPGSAGDDVHRRQHRRNTETSGVRRGVTERRDSFELYKIYYEDIAGVAPCGAIVANIEDMSHWLTALMNDGKYRGKPVLPSEVLKATMRPAIALPNTGLETRGWQEILNTAYGMGRQTTTYRGHLLTSHGGNLRGF